MGPWIVHVAPEPQSKLRLLCIPYAGGGWWAYRDWPSALPGVEVCAAALPGRGQRLSEPPERRLGSVLAAMEDELHGLLDRPLALFGHSVGALVAFELARRVATTGLLVHLFVSGFRAPHLPNPLPALCDLPDSELLEAARRYDGIPSELGLEDDVVQLTLPALRADLALAERYVYHPAPPLPVPCTAFCGLADEIVPRALVEPWRIQVAGEFGLVAIPGNHMFIHTARARLVSVVGRKLGN